MFSLSLSQAEQYSFWFFDSLILWLITARKFLGPFEDKCWVPQKFRFWKNLWHLTKESLAPPPQTFEPLLSYVVRLGYTRFWPTILYQYYTGGKTYYTILYLYQYYTNFLGGLFMALCILHGTNPFKNVRGIKTFSWVTQSLWPPTPPLHSSLYQLLNIVALLLKNEGRGWGAK